MQALSREVVAMFFKDARNRVRLNNLVVLQEERSNSYGVYVCKQFWDVDYSKEFGYIYHMSGAGGGDPIEVSGLYHTTATTVAKRLLGEPLVALEGLKIVEKPPQWVDARDKDSFDNKPRTLTVRKRNRTRRLNKLPKHIDLQPGQDMLDWLRVNGIESNSVWCSICRDCFPGECSYDLCKHVWWCEKIGDYSTPDDRCKCKDAGECRD